VSLAGMAPAPKLAQVGTISRGRVL